MITLSNEEHQQVEVAVQHYQQQANLSQVNWSAIYQANPNIVARITADKGSYILKVPRNEEKARGYHQEASLMKLAEKRLNTIIRVPTKIVESTDPAYLTYSEVKGKIIKWNKLLTIDESRRKAIGAKLGKLLASWHTTPFDKFQEMALPVGPHDNDVPLRLLSDACDAVQKDLDISDSLRGSFNSATTAIANLSLANGSVTTNRWQMRLLHNDINANNFVFDGSDELIGLIDFGNARFDDIHADFKFLCYRDWNHLGNSAIDAYQSARGVTLDSVHLRFQALLAGLSVVRWGKVVEDSNRRDDVTKFLDFYERNPITET